MLNNCSWGKKCRVGDYFAALEELHQRLSQPFTAMATYCMCLDQAQDQKVCASLALPVEMKSHGKL
jgi:hypothetical protein